MMKIWAFILLLSIASLLYAHFLQNYLFMRPCEQCVYLRFAMCVMVLGAIFGLFGDVISKKWLKFSPQSLNKLNIQNKKTTTNSHKTPNLKSQNFQNSSQNSSLNSQNLNPKNSYENSQNFRQIPRKNFSYFLTKFCQILAILLSFFGIYLGFKHAFLLNKIHAALKNNNPFGVSGCSQSPHFPLSLPLDELIPSFFAPNGACGMDAPFVPSKANLSTLQSLFLGTFEQNFTDGLYSNGWYLVPKFEFLNMANACALIFGAFAVLLMLKFALYIKHNFYQNL